MLRKHFYLAVKQFEALKKLSARTGLSVAELVRRAIDMLLGKESGE